MRTNTTVSPVDAMKNNAPIGAGLGAVAFVLNFVASYAFITIDGVDTGDTATWKAAGQTLYNAQFVSTEASGGGSSTTYNLVTGDGAFASATDVTSTVPSLVYHLVPIVVLVGAGFIVYKQAGARVELPGAAATGASIAAGYLVLSIVGVFLFETSSGGTSAQPELVPAILIAGLVFPLVFGAIGGAIGKQTE